MLQRNIANRYASALFILARDKGALESIEADFPPVASAIESNKDLSDFISHPSIQGDEKKKVLGGLLKRKNDLLSDFLSLVVDKRREAYIPLMWEGYRDQLMQHRNRLEAEVATPFELSDEVKSALSAKLQKITGKAVEIKQVVDPDLIGGVRVRMGDRVIDGSIVHRLQVMKETLRTARV